MAVLPSEIGEQRVILHNVDWETFLALLGENEDHDGRFHYDRGTLEIMSPSEEHGWSKTQIGRLVEQYALDKDVDIRLTASTTFKRPDLQAAFEADESYYIQRVAQVRDRFPLDLTRDPPPDLVIEVEISRSILGKAHVYGLIGVPEIWRYDGETLCVFHRQRDGTYCEAASSLAFPDLAVGLIPQALALRKQGYSDNRIVRWFMERV